MDTIITICTVCDDTHYEATVDNDGGVFHYVCPQCWLNSQPEEYFVNYSTFDTPTAERWEVFNDLDRARTFCRRVVEEGGSATLEDQFGEHAF